MDSTILGREHCPAPIPAKLLSSLCSAVGSHPRASMQELAERIGISRATLHRLCGTRENLDRLLEQHTKDSLRGILQRATPQTTHPLSALQQLIHDHLAQGELIVFLASRYHPHLRISRDPEADWSFYQDELDAFFLRSQQLGIFRIDLTAPLLTEVFVSILYGAIDSRNRGRIPGDCYKLIATFFLRGAAYHPADAFEPRTGRTT